jgi:hypothetical protein
MARFELQKLYIDGGYSDAGSDATFEAINPANGEVLANVQRATKEDVERAVVSAEKGQKIWAAMTAMERSRILRRAVDILRERNDELAALETLDTGKPYSETQYVDIVTGADVLEYYAGLVPAIEGEQIPLRDTSFVYTRREPLGVVADRRYPQELPVVAVEAIQPRHRDGKAGLELFRHGLDERALFLEASRPGHLEANQVDADIDVRGLLGIHKLYSSAWERPLSCRKPYPWANEQQLAFSC